MWVVPLSLVSLFLFYLLISAFFAVTCFLCVCELWSMSFVDGNRLGFFDRLSVCNKKAGLNHYDHFGMHRSSLDNNLQEVLKNTNKLEATLSIIKADFLWVKTFSRELVRWKALIQPVCIHKNFRCRESNWHFRKLAVRTTYAKWILEFVRFSLHLTYFLPHTQTHTFVQNLCAFSVWSVLWISYLAQLINSVNWVMLWNVYHMRVQSFFSVCTIQFSHLYNA